MQASQAAAKRGEGFSSLLRANTLTKWNTMNAALSGGTFDPSYSSIGHSVISSFHFLKIEKQNCNQQRAEDIAFQSAIQSSIPGTNSISPSKLARWKCVVMQCNFSTSPQGAFSC